MKRNLAALFCGIAVFILTVSVPLKSYAQEGEGGYIEDSPGDYMESSNDTSAQEADDGGVNSGVWGAIIEGSFGYGQTMFGYVTGSTDSNTFGAGRGTGLDMSGMLNFTIFAVKLEYTRSSLKTLKWSQSGNDIETGGSGNFSTLDLLLGAKVFTEEDDMGYTHFFLGLRYWSILRDESSYLVNGSPFGTPSKYEQTGSGWIFGYHDLSTFPLGPASLALETGLWFDSAPYKTFKVNGSDTPTSAGTAIGFGMNLGIGVALEDMGLLVTVGWKTDITATEFSILGSDGNITGAGYSLTYIKAAKEF